MNYREAVNEGRVLVERQDVTQWALGDLALEVAPMGDTAAHNGSSDKLEKFADDIGIAFNTLREYRAIASAIPPARRMAGTSWSAHQVLRTQLDKLKPNMTLTQARKAAGVNDRARQPIEERESPAARAMRAASDLADPEVRKELHQNTRARDEVMHGAAMVEEERIRSFRPDGKRKQSKAFNGLSLFGLHADMIQAKQKIAGVLKALPEQELDDEYREILHEDIEKIDGVLGFLRDYLNSGETDFESALATLLSEED